MDAPPPTAMKRNPVTGEMEEFHSEALKVSRPETASHTMLSARLTPSSSGHTTTLILSVSQITTCGNMCCSENPTLNAALQDDLPEEEAESAEIEIPTGDDY